MSIKPFTINDILYTKDGRKSGNLTCVHITSDELPLVYFVSDYGNLIHYKEAWLDNVRTAAFKNYYATRGTCKTGHKYYNYYNTHPEMFI